MKKRLVVSFAAALGVAALSAATPASAATEIGSNCAANGAVEPGISILQRATPGGLPVPAPVAGVITRWKVAVIAGLKGTRPQQLKVFRSTPAPKQLLVVAESLPGEVGAGSNSFETRIPVLAGDRLGLAGGEVGAFFCTTGDAGDSVSTIAGNPALGSIATVAEDATKAQVAVAAIIEPDADGDGFGDETQDKCPQSAVAQIPCPPIGVSAFAIARKGSATLLVATDFAAPVAVTATVRLGKGRTATLSASPKAVAAGSITVFSLKFPKSLKGKLAALPPKRKLKLRLTATATNVIGQTFSASTEAKLRGREKPAPK